MATSSENSGHTLELRVGLFVLVGLAIIGYMVVVLGRFGNGVKPSYTLTVELPNASGLLKNSKVLMAGAQVGSVVAGPDLLDHARGVAVKLRIQEPAHIARNAQVVVGSSGLMGDRFVDVLPAAQDKGGYYGPGEIVHGTRAQGMDDLTAKGGQLVDDLRAAVANLNGTITRLNTEMLKPETFKNLQDSMANLSVTTNNFKAASEKLGGVLDDAHGVVTPGPRGDGRREGHPRQREGRRRRRARGHRRHPQGARHRADGGGPGRPRPRADGHAHFQQGAFGQHGRARLQFASQRRAVLQRSRRRVIGRTESDARGDAPAALKRFGVLRLDAAFPLPKRAG